MAESDCRDQGNTFAIHTYAFMDVLMLFDKAAPLKANDTGVWEAGGQMRLANIYDTYFFLRFTLLQS